MALNITVAIVSADLRFMALQPGSAMEGLGPDFTNPSCSSFPEFWRCPFTAGFTLAELTE